VKVTITSSQASLTPYFIDSIAVVSGFASMKFSGSLTIFGVNIENMENTVIATINPIMSFVIKYVWNGIMHLSQFAGLSVSRITKNAVKKTL